MNQILFTINHNPKIKDNSKKMYLFLFVSFIILILIIFFFFFYNRYIIYIKNSNSKDALNIYKISTLYSDEYNYTAITLSNEISIIGLIEVPNINISYPILSKSNDELLKISPCRFAGPLPNRYGNMCIAAHNYKNNLMFSKLNKLQKNDSIYITDLNKNRIEYIVYNKYTTNEEDLSCTNQENNIEITLITCNTTNNKERVIIKAKMKEL